MNDIIVSEDLWYVHIACKQKAGRRHQLANYFTTCTLYFVLGFVFALYVSMFVCMFSASDIIIVECSDFYQLGQCNNMIHDFGLKIFKINTQDFIYYSYIYVYIQYVYVYIYVTVTFLECMFPDILKLVLNVIWVQPFLNFFERSNIHW